MPEIWAGLDIGKKHHHGSVDADGKRLLSRRVMNDESELLQLIADVLEISRDVLWAVDINTGIAALAIGLLLNHGQSVAYLTGRTIHRASTTYRGEGKTDARDAFIIADQTRILRRQHAPPRRRHRPRPATPHRPALGRRPRPVPARSTACAPSSWNSSPPLERALDLTKKGPVILLTAYQTPAAIRRMGVRRLETWLRNRKVQRAGALAAAAVEAAQAQMTAMRGEAPGAELVGRLACSVALPTNDGAAELDARIEARFRQHRDAEIILSMPGMGPTTGAEFIAATGGDLAATRSRPSRRVRRTGPSPRGLPEKSSGNLRRPRRYHRGLQQPPLYLSTQVGVFFCPVSRRTTTGREKRARDTSKLSSPSHADASTSSGP